MKDNLIGPKEIAEYLNISINTIYSWINMRKIPFFKIGRLVKFDLKEIENWKEHQKVDVLDFSREAI